MESVMDILLTGPKTVAQVLDEYQNRFLPESDSQLLRAQFTFVVQLPNESVQKLHACMRVLLFWGNVPTSLSFKLVTL